ncbi:MAG TPA: response regulator [Bacteroidota bacterium]
MIETDKLNLLVAEDEESFLRVLTTVLEATHRFKVTSCETGDEAIAALSKTPFDLLILDHKMPGKTGLNVLQWLNEQKSAIPVIMLTGAGSENIAVEAMKLGAYDYVRKDQFDKHHFPIVVNAVYERFQFKMEKEKRDIDAKQQQVYLASLELLRNSVSSFSQIVSSTLTTIGLLTDESERLMQPHVFPEGKEYFKRYFRKMREEYDTLATVTQSMVSLTKVMYDNYQERQGSLLPQKEQTLTRRTTHAKTASSN